MRTYNLSAEQIRDFCQDAIDCGEVPTNGQIENAVGEYALAKQPVRCRDCRFYKRGDDGWWCLRSISMKSNQHDGFCAWGEELSDDDPSKKKITVEAEDLLIALFDLKDIGMYEFSADPEEDHELLVDAIARLEKYLKGYK